VVAHDDARRAGFFGGDAAGDSELAVRTLPDFGAFDGDPADCLPAESGRGHVKDDGGVADAGDTEDGLKMVFFDGAAFLDGG